MQSPQDEIRELNARYALAADEGPGSSWADCFTEQGIFNWGGDLVGRTALEEFQSSYLESLDGVQPRHVLTSVAADITGDQARGFAYWVVFHTRDNQTRLAAIGRYEDELQRVAGRWLFARRNVIVDSHQNPFELAPTQSQE
ncbi:nuclear transport factor 2 family protein [Nocardia sp. NPDC004123]